MPNDVGDNDGVPISEGDAVWTKFRGGKREGEVDKVVTTEKQADNQDVKNPPKVSS